MTSNNAIVRRMPIDESEEEKNLVLTTSSLANNWPIYVGVGAAVIIIIVIIIIILCCCTSKDNTRANKFYTFDDSDI